MTATEVLRVGPDTVVTVSYDLFSDVGELVEQATTDDPLVYVHGYAQIVPGLERALVGKAEGDKLRIELKPEDAFGEREDNAVFELERDTEEDEPIEVGDELVGEGPDGEAVSLRVLEVREDALLVDANHPLAGKGVRFELEVKGVRPATEDEIAEAQAELEEEATARAAHDHDHDHANCGHDHGHDGDAAAHGEAGHVNEAPSLVQLKLGPDHKKQ